MKDRQTCSDKISQMAKQIGLYKTNKRDHSHTLKHNDWTLRLNYALISCAVVFVTSWPTALMLTRAQINRYCLKIYLKMCHKIILRQKL